MIGSERRLDTRVRVEMFLNQYMKEEACRALAVNVSENGLYLQRLAEPVTRHSRVVALEFELPGTGEIVWAKGESRFAAIDDDFHFTGVRFLAMARKHERLVRDWVFDKSRRIHSPTWLRLKLGGLTRPPS